MCNRIRAQLVSLKNLGGGGVKKREAGRGALLPKTAAAADIENIWSQLPTNVIFPLSVRQESKEEEKSDV